MASDLFAALIARDPVVDGLLPFCPTDEGSWDAAVSRAAGRTASRGLLDELARQTAALPTSAARERNLAALGQPGATVVVTGQQVGLFLGPLYTLHKAATAVARARWVSERSGRPCIPLFWLQTEDHDWAEIAQVQVLVGARREVLRLPAETAAQARVSIAQRTLPEEVAALTEALAELLQPLPHGPEVSALVSRHYRAGRSPGSAFGALLAELFSEEGLLVLDPRTPAMARLGAPLLKRALLGHDRISAALSARARELAALGFDEQVPTRPEASLVFFHPRGPDGPRFRLVRQGAGFCTVDGPVSSAALLEQLERDPLWFSTSALLRPLVQDTLLPTAGYVGGPAECTYFAQLPPLYSLLDVAMPMVAPRARFRVLDTPIRRALDRLGLRPEDVDRPREELAAQVQERPEWLPSPEALRARLLGPLERELDALLPHAASVEPRLEKSIRKTREGVSRSVGKLLARLERAALARDHVAAERLDRLLTALRPDGIPQERVDGFPALAARSGPRTLVAALVAAAHPLSPDVRNVSP